MMLFGLIAAALMIAITALLVFPLIRPGKHQPAETLNDEARTLSLTVLREQLTDLERERAEGTLDEETFAHTKEELERRALEDAVADAPRHFQQAPRAMAAVAVALILPLLSIGLYALQGNPSAISGGKGHAESAAGGHEVTSAQIAAMVEKLSSHLREKPDDGPGWVMLARSYGAMGRFDESVKAYNRAVVLLPPDAQLLADFADVTAMAQGRKLQGEPENLVNRALKIDPQNLKALALAGTIAFDHQDYAKAVAHWQKIVDQVPPGSDIANSIQDGIREAQERLGLKPAPLRKESPAAAGPTGLSKDAGITGSVTVAAPIKDQASPKDAVFIFVKAVNGPKMPLAILRKTVADLPLEFTLDDSQAMVPGTKLSAYPEVVVGARISKSGDAIAHAGDLEGFSPAVKPGQGKVKIVIDRVKQ